MIEQLSLAKFSQFYDVYYLDTRSHYFTYSRTPEKWALIKKA